MQIVSTPENRYSDTADLYNSGLDRVELIEYINEIRSPRYIILYIYECGHPIYYYTGLNLKLLAISNILNIYPHSILLINTNYYKKVLGTS